MVSRALEMVCDMEQLSIHIQTYGISRIGIILLLSPSSATGGVGTLPGHKSTKRIAGISLVYTYSKSSSISSSIVPYVYSLTSTVFTKGADCVA
jgi:hypothetical protein